MNITTKFDLGQTVVFIWHEPTERIVNCDVCDGTGWIHVKGTRYLCPECNGRRTTREHIPARWHIVNTGIIGRIEVETRIHEPVERDPAHPHLTQTPLGPMAINYMLDVTGIGSGTMHYEPNVFETAAEAQAECDRRNAGNKERGAE